jgi:hypothetical protein
MRGDESWHNEMTSKGVGIRCNVVQDRENLVLIPRLGQNSAIRPFEMMTIKLQAGKQMLTDR